MRKRGIWISGSAIGVILVALLILWPAFQLPTTASDWRNSSRSLPLAEYVFAEPCTYDYDYEEYLDCIGYGYPRRYKGIWVYAFEYSFFFEGAQTPPKVAPNWKEHPSLEEPRSFNLDAYSGYNDDLGCYATYAFAIDFVGRRHRELKGHLDMAPSGIRVDRVISFEPLGELDCNTYYGDD